LLRKTTTAVNRLIRRLIHRANHAREKWKKEGLTSWLWRNFVVEVWPFFYQRKTILWLERELCGEVEPIEPKIRAQIRVVDDGGADLVPSLVKAAETGWSQSSFVRETLQKGGRCYVAVNGGEVLAYLWITTRLVAIKEPHLGDVDCEPALSENEFYIFKVFTFPQYRGLRLIPALITAAARDLSPAGYRKASMAVHDHNTPMLRAAARAGFATCQIITRYRLFLILRLYRQEHISPCAATIRPKARTKLW
jgi:ribosomal protein S18 acetylase RimI-like enzyme